MPRPKKTNRTIKTCTKCIYFDKENRYCTMYEFKAHTYDATDCIRYKLNGVSLYDKMYRKKDT